MCAYLEEDDEGFARVSRVSLRPSGDGAYIRTQARSAIGSTVTVWVPVDRYYLPEALAPEAERAYRDAARNDESETCVSVRVRSGTAVLEDLYIGGVPLREALKPRATRD